MAYDIERYLNVRSASAPSFGPNGELAFLMETTGENQVWRVDEPEAWPDQISFGEERVTSASFSPTREELIYGMDEGGDEFVQLFRLSADGSEDVPLTDHPDAIHQFGGWSHDGDRFAFAANRRDQATFDVYVQGRDETGADATLVAEGDEYDNLSVAGWSPSDDRLVLHESHSNYDQDLHVVDVASGEVTHATEFADETRFSSVSWAPDGNGLFVCTDHGADTLYLGVLDPDGGTIEHVVDGGGWELEAVGVDPEAERLVYVRNVDGYSELTLADVHGAPLHALRQSNATTGVDELLLDPLPTPDIPEGVVMGLSFDDAAERVAIAVSAPTENTNVHVVDVETGESERWTRASTAGIPRETFRSPELVHFESFDGLDVPGFLTMPDGDGPHPVVVDIHGGPEVQRRPFFMALRQYFTDNGYAVFEPNVRGSAGYGTEYLNLDNVRNRMDSVKDLRAGVEWLTANRPIDPERVVAYGGSYGGFMVLAALTEYPDLWAAGVDIVGIANFVTFLENTGDWRRERREAEYGSLADDREFLESISPVNNAEKIRAPLLVLHGANDPRVPVDEAEQIASIASEHVPVEKTIFEDEGHGFAKHENQMTAYRQVVDFLEKHV
ncbi:S9 family peptidase [Halobacterium zhouii]|uniref:S9 family peptidase n=1 Tax=Halobacterium zhouii TaxID=2902624 RepID=UPI001E471C07|nr:S9 family peptidase [Halobacterium zhouii]